MVELKVSNDVVIYFSDNTPYIVDTRINEEYEIDNPKLLSDLFAYISGHQIEQSERQVLVDGGVLVPNERPELLKNFGNDFLDIFHRGCTDVLNHIQVLSAVEYADLYLESCVREPGDVPPPRAKSISLKDTRTVNLPEFRHSVLEAVSLFDVLDRRKTVREFFPHQATLEQLSDLLFCSFGYFHKHKNGEAEQYEPFKRRTSPSGGCLQSVEAYVCVFNVEGLDNGIYWYDAENHALKFVENEISYDELSAMLVSQFFGNDCSFGVFLAANLERFTWKYKTTRAYRVVSMEIGHFSQTAQLVGTAMGLNTWITGAFNDAKIEQTLHLHDERSIPLFFLAFGKGKYDRMHSLMKKRLERLKANGQG
ncbi:hypothetical protein MXMO3_03470 (plasmid) [Maritalea myrionectae]|uniref:Nitroreductase domain-containing protein n=1 Tax=Maritalea myrionectae TaxID=454601 RepID=A0A2R4MJ14_9HYPH|nr:SagB/ThcOx family dehydrogenase [Maritalea myrionectae]AVX05973.1 hypothetical protein MXMO3_03470 [Maritalea myrionectae]